jgi:hypothetical protein
VSGSERNTGRASHNTWYDLVDPVTEQVVGQVTRQGEVRSDDPDVERRVRAAFSRELLTRNDEVAEELGVCFADIATVGPDDAAHHDLVFRNLGALTGLIPAERRDGQDTG